MPQLCIKDINGMITFLNKYSATFAIQGPIIENMHGPKEINKPNIDINQIILINVKNPQTIVRILLSSTRRNIY